MSNKFKLNVNDQGKVKYIACVGKDLYQGTATLEQAQCMIIELWWKNKED